MVRKYGHGMGWFLESQRHRLASKGVKTGRKDYAKDVLSASSYELKGIDYAKSKKIEVNEGNLVNYIMEYEGGNMTNEQMLQLFAYLIRSGQAWHLQGMYGRQANRFIENGLITKDGKVNYKEVDKHGIDKKAMIYDEAKKIDFASRHLSKALGSLPTLATGQADDLKVDTGTKRVWVSRVDGSISVERLNKEKGRWELVDTDEIDYAKAYDPRKQIFVDKNPNGSLTLSTDMQKKTYYGYNKTDALKLFRKELKK